MNKWWRSIFCLHPLLTTIIALPAYGLVIYVLITPQVSPALQYFAYGLSAYALIISVTATVKIASLVHRGGMMSLTPARLFISTTFGARYINDAAFRTLVSLYIGLSINICYAVAKLITGFVYDSLWFGVLAVYYLVLAAMRFVLLRYSGTANQIDEYKCCRICGVLLVILNQALAAVVFLMVRQNYGYNYPGLLIYAMAAYTFYNVTKAVVDLIKYRHYGSPLLSAVKVVSLSAALVSLLSLETAMLTQFGAVNDMQFRQTMVAATGAAVCVIVFAAAVTMLVRSVKGLHNIKIKSGESPYEKQF